MTTTRHRNFTVAAKPLLPSFALDIAGVPGAGSALAPTYVATRLIDGQYWNAGGVTWQVAPVANPLLELDAINLPGFYTDPIGIPAANLDPATVGYDIEIYYQELVTPYQDFEHVTLETHVWDQLETNFTTVGSFGELMKVIAGLSFRYYRQFNYTYDPVTNQVTSCKIRVYATQADATADVNHLLELDWNTSYAAGVPSVSISR